MKITIAIAPLIRGPNYWEFISSASYKEAEFASTLGKPGKWTLKSLQIKEIYKLKSTFLKCQLFVHFSMILSRS